MKQEDRELLLADLCARLPYYPKCEMIDELRENVLAYHEYTTKEEATKALRMLWHEEAKKYLWEHKLERKCNKYLW